LPVVLIDDTDSYREVKAALVKPGYVEEGYEAFPPSPHHSTFRRHQVVQVVELE
jgi:hypothetical protein